MAGLNETPKANRVHIAFFGLRNAGKSTLVNAFAGQDIAIVSDVAGTTTDPVSKAMEILPLGPCILTDTAGLDDIGELGAMRVRKSFAVLATADIAVWVVGDKDGTDSHDTEAFRMFSTECAKHGVSTIEYHRNEPVEEFRKRIAAIKVSEQTKPLVGDLVSEGDVVLLVCPQDGSAPKGRLILPQQQVIRELLDVGAAAMVCQPGELAHLVAAIGAERIRFAVTDSQAFGAVSIVLPREIPLTSFSILFARQKGDLKTLCRGAAAIGNLEDTDTVLIAEGCTHRRQCGDIGSVKIPRWLERHTGKKLKFAFASGGDFPIDGAAPPKLVVHCGGCMLTRRAVMARLRKCAELGVPVVNYGVAIGLMHGIVANPETCMVER